MNIPKIKDDESLAMWRERLAQEFNLDYQMQELIREVSITSYIHGTDAIIDVLKKEGRLLSYGELTLPPVWTGINKQTGRFLKGHVPANKGKKWSEEDETMITDLSVIVHTYFSEISGIPFKYDLSEDKIRTWLKSLKDRYTWKPSEEQMKALKEAVDEHFDIDGGALWHLYENLKKLMEE
jgi:hypothetical protein